MKKIKLFCIPYAGGSAIIYKKWQSLLSPNIEIVAVELAGRGRRSNDPLYKDVAEAVNDIYNLMIPEINECDEYAIFGHSMGAMLSYELAQKIRKNSLPQPIHIFFSGRGVPHIRSKREKSYHTMEDKEFKNEIMNLGGTPKEFFDYPELMDYLIPILKNDFKISETADRNEEIEPLDCGISVLIGKEEAELDAENIHGWSYHSTKMCSIHYFNGGHFFINHEMKKITEIINYNINAIVADTAKGWC